MSWAGALAGGRACRRFARAADQRHPTISRDSGSRCRFDWHVWHILVGLVPSAGTLRAWRAMCKAAESVAKRRAREFTPSPLCTLQWWLAWRCGLVQT